MCEIAIKVLFKVSSLVRKKVVRLTLQLFGTADFLKYSNDSLVSTS